MPERRRYSSAFLAISRASRLYGSRVMGSMTSQIRKSVLCERTGSMVAESGSGMRSMSLSSMDWNPRMLEPSNPSPSEKLPSSSSPSGRLKCCQVPGRSTKRTSTTSTPSALARSSTSRGLVLLPDLVTIAMNTPSWILGFGFDGPHDRRYPQASPDRALRTNPALDTLWQPHVLERPGAAIGWRRVGGSPPLEGTLPRPTNAFRKALMKRKLILLLAAAVTVAAALVPIAVMADDLTATQA